MIKIRQRKLFDIKPDSATLKVGWFSNTTYPDGTPVGYVASIHEYGNPARNLPARPFMMPTVDRKQSEWTDTLIRTLQRDKDMPLSEAMEIIGNISSSDVAQTIKDITSPPLARSTVAQKEKKGSTDKPLIDTALLWQSLSYKVGL